MLFDVDEQPDKAMQYGIDRVPTFYWCVRSTDKAAGKRFVGTRTAAQLQAALRELPEVPDDGEWM